MATGSGHMSPGWFVLLQCPVTWHQGGWDGNRAWPHATREAEIATGSGQMAQGGWDCDRVWPHGTRVAGMATGQCHMTQGRLGWQQGLAT